MSAVRVSLEIRAERRAAATFAGNGGIWPTWSVVAASQWRPAPEGWITQLPAGALEQKTILKHDDLPEERNRKGVVMTLPIIRKRADLDRWFVILLTIRSVAQSAIGIAVMRRTPVTLPSAAQ
eukprot:scaffold20744_cov66-Phaeocystis_antarctica.AAC.1